MDSWGIGDNFFFIIIIGNKTFIEKTEHHVHDGEHFEQETNTTKSGTKVNKM